MNKAILVGNLGAEVELKYTKSGTAVATLNLATTDKKKNQDGSWEDVTEWHRCIIWSKTAENAAKYLKKGSKVLVEGRLQTRKWQDKDGADRYTTEINVASLEFLDSKSSGGDQAQSQQWQEQPQSKPAAPKQVGSGLDDIPF